MKAIVMLTEVQLKELKRAADTAWDQRDYRRKLTPAKKIAMRRALKKLRDAPRL